MNSILENSENESIIENDPILQRAFGIGESTETPEAEEPSSEIPNIVEDTNSRYLLPELSVEDKSIIQEDPILQQAFNIKSAEEDPIVQQALMTAESAQVEEDATLTNLIGKGFEAVKFEISNSPQNVRAMASALTERLQPGFIYGQSNPDEVYMADVYDPQIGDSFFEQTTYNVSKTIGEFLYTLGTTGVGAAGGTVIPGLGTGVGAAVGRTIGAGSVAAAIFNQTLKEGYNKYLQAGMDKSKAFNRATDDAIAEAAVEFGSEWFAGKLIKLGLPVKNLVKNLTSLVAKGEVKVAEEGLQLTAKGASTIKDLIKTIVKGAAIEGGEEGIQQSWEVGRHREEGQSWGQALWENKGEIAKSAAIGATAGGIGVGAGLGIGKTIDVAGTALEEKVNGSKRKEYETAVDFVNKDIEREKGIESESEIEQQEKEPIQEPKPIGDEYGEEIEGAQKVDAQGDTVLTPESVKETKEEIDNNELTELTIEDTNNTEAVSETKREIVSVDSKLNQQNNLNENTPPQTVEQRRALTTTRKEISKTKKFNNTEEENLIPGSVSDDGYMPIDGQPLDGNGFSKKDELPSTPTTVKNNIQTHNDETKEAFSILGIDEDEEIDDVDYEEDTTSDYVIKNKQVSRFHKYYAIKNLIESIGIKIAGKGEEVFKLYTKAELTGKEKAITNVEQNVMGYVKPAENNVIRISNSRDYSTNVHEMFHHLIYQLKYGSKELQDSKLREALTDYHKKLTKKYSGYELDELGYMSQGQDVVPEYACNLAGAYVTGDIELAGEVKQFFDDAFEKLGVTKELNIAKQIFRDWNAIRNRKDGDLDVTINDSRAARLLAKGEFDTVNLNESELSFYNKTKSKIKSIPGTVLAGVFNETWQLEADARRSKNTRTLTKANQALLNVSKIEDAFFMGTGGYFHNGIFTKLHGNYAIDNLTKIQNETKKIGEEYPDKLNALLHAKQTIGENLGSQAKADYLLQMAKDLGYNHWLDAWEDLRLVSKFFEKNVYQNIEVTDEAWNKIAEDIKKYKNRIKGKHNVTTTRYLNVNNKTKDRVNKIIKYAQKGNKSLAILDKTGSYNTGMSLGAAINVITSLQNDPHLDELLAAEDKVRQFITALDNLMITSDVSSRLRILSAKQDTGAWYIPLIRFIDENEEKAKGATAGNSLRSRTGGGSEREIVDIFTSIENSVRAVAKQVCTNQAIDYLMKLKDEPIFAQYIREIPQDSKEVSADMTQVFANKISALNKELHYYDVTGAKVDPERITFIKDYIKKLQDANKQLEETGTVDKDAYVDLFILQPPTNRNVIQRLEGDGKVHYYLVDDRIKSFLYDQRKTLSSILDIEVINRNEAIKNILGTIFKFNKLVHLLCRASFTIFNPGFQTTNFSRDSADVALKAQEDAYSKGILLPVYYTKNMAGIAELIARATTAKGREDFRRIVDMYSSAGQTQYAEGEHNINYLDYTVNKKGKIVRGGFNGMLSMVTEVLSNTDMLPRIVAIQQYAKKKGIDLETIDMTFADYSSLNGTKRVLSKYYKADDIERILGKDKREMWDNTPDNEYFAYVPEEFEQRQLSELIKDKYSEIERNFDIDTYSEMQELFDKSSIDFSRGTPIARTLGKICLFANTRLQGGYQLFQYVGTHKKTATGALASMATMALLAVISGLDDDEASDEDRARGINLKINGKRFRIPTQSLIIYPYNLFRGLFKEILDSDGIDDIKSDLITALGDNSWEAISQPTGVTAIALNSTSIFYTGKNFNFGDTEKYHKFTPYQIEKMGSNVDRLIKKGDSVLAYSLSKWLVNNGCSKFSTHEIERYLEGFWGSAEKQVESLLGMRLVLEDKNVDVNWLDWKISIADSFLATATKQYLPNEQPFSKDIDYLRTASKSFTSLYDRLTGQIGTTADDRMWPYELYSNGEITEEDMNKYEELLAKSEIAKEYNDHIKYMTNILYSINTEKKGGQKAYNELASQIKKIAKQYKKVLTGKLNEEDIDINDEDLEYILEENEAAPEEDSILKRVFD